MAEVFLLQVVGKILKLVLVLWFGQEKRMFELVFR